MNNRFALLDEDHQSAPKAPKAAPAATAAPKRQGAAPQQKDRHTKGGRSQGENTAAVQKGAKRFNDRHTSRTKQGLGKERKGEDRPTKGSWGNKDASADQVAATDVDPKAAVEEPVVVEEPKEELPKVFTMKDHLASRSVVSEDKKLKVRKATAVAEGESVYQGAAVVERQVVSTLPGKSTINKNRKTFDLSEFQAIQGGAPKVQQQRGGERRQTKKATSFPAL